MKRLFNYLLISFLLLASLLVIMRMQACTHVKSCQCEKLAYTIQNPQNQFLKQDFKKEYSSITKRNIISSASRIRGGFDCVK